MKKEVKNHRNYKTGTGTRIKGKSETIQDDTLSVADLLMKHINGGELRAKPGVYIDDADLDDEDGQAFHQMDLADKEMVINRMRDTKKRIAAQEQLWEEEKARKQAENEEKAKKDKTSG